jgi:elongation factor Tu
MTDNKIFKSEKPCLTVGAIGHVDHGKTTLTHAITTVLAKQGKAKIANYDEIDEAPEEKKRVIGINSVYIEYETEKRHYTHIDCTGLADYVKCMMTSATEMDAAILVVSAPDGPEPQTCEHILLCRQSGLEHIIVYLSKCDQLGLNDEYIFELVEDEIRGLLTQYGFNGENTVIIRGSALMALSGEDNDKGYGLSSIERLIDALDSVIPDCIRNIDSPFLMPVGDVFSITGMKTWAVGKIESGIIKIGDEVELVGLRGVAQMKDE